MRAKLITRANGLRASLSSRALAAEATMRVQPYFWTVCGIGVGVLAIVIWMLTFQPGGVELSHYLFPLSALILERIFYPTSSIPAPLWYGGALLQWLVIGAVVDLLRKVFRRE